MNDCLENYLNIKQKIVDYALQFNRDPAAIKLLAVSKGQTVEKIRHLYAAGQRSFGENYLQEALLKMAACQDLAIEWHYIGHVQRNKTKKIAENFAWLDSLATVDIAERLNRQRPASLPPLNICISVNIDDDSNKHGCRVQDLPNLVKQVVGMPQLKLRGLMVITKHPATHVEKMHSFIHMSKLYTDLCQQGLSLDTLSMGMSDDIAEAIELGTTILRIGTSIFGQRNKNSIQ